MVILDTAGRLHVDEALMDELRAIKDVARPQEILFVADAMTGQDAVTVAEAFNEKLGITRRCADQDGRRRPGRSGPFH